MMFISFSTNFVNVYEFSEILIGNENSEFGKQVNSCGPHSAHNHSAAAWRPTVLGSPSGRGNPATRHVVRA
jgi:hypothetical protein